MRALVVLAILYGAWKLLAYSLYRVSLHCDDFAVVWRKRAGSALLPESSERRYDSRVTQPSRSKRDDCVGVASMGRPPQERNR